MTFFFCSKNPCLGVRWKYGLCSNSKVSRFSMHATSLLKMISVKLLQLFRITFVTFCSDIFRLSCSSEYFSIFWLKAMKCRPRHFRAEHFCKSCTRSLLLANLHSFNVSIFRVAKNSSFSNLSICMVILSNTKICDG